MPLNIDFQQICLHMLNFVILFAILYFLLYKPVRNFMQKRRGMYEMQEKETAEKLAEAENLKKTYHEKIAHADEEARQIHADAEREAASIRKTAQQKAQADADDLLKQAQEQAEREHEQMMQKSSRELADAISGAARRMAFADTSEAYDAFLDAAEGKESDEGH